MAGLFVLLGVRALSSGDDGDPADTAYRAGYSLGPFLLAVLLLAAAGAAQFLARRRRRLTAERQLPAQRELWQRRRQVWQAAWLCRRCRVAFLPAASVGPDVPASSPVAPEEFPLLVTATADRAFGPGAAAG
ncbi:hypothetical protein OH807_02195 [Kitasatospora sp. NBC_01560]|uniref:hypothetical protein n=1 Tax=Kitasatospora sp. NBC_01560 TaxID=2975965 RepID=UPI00386D35F2